MHQKDRSIRPILKNLALMAGSVFVIIVIVELFVFYVLDIKPKSYRPERFFQYSPIAGHFHRPSASGNWYRYLSGKKFHVKTNSFGYADDERTLTKNKRRIALIGDSTTEMWEVNESERCQYLIENRLGGAFEVLNFGVRAYGTDQTLLLFKNLGIHFQPDVVVYLFCVNDLRDNVDTRGKPYFEVSPDNPDSLVLRNFPAPFDPDPPRYGWLHNHSYVYRRISELRNQLRIGTRIRRLMGRGDEVVRSLEKGQFELRPYKRTYDANDEYRWRVTLGLIDELSD